MPESNYNIENRKMELSEQRQRRRRLCSVVAPQLKVEYTQEGKRTVVIEEETNVEPPRNVVSLSAHRENDQSSNRLMEDVLNRHYSSLQRQSELRRLDKADLTSTALPHEENQTHHIDIISSGFLPAERPKHGTKPELAINLSAKPSACVATRKTQRSMSAHSVALPGPDSSVLRDPETGKMYKRGKLLGKGGFARVYEGVDLQTGKKYALKIIDKSRLSRPPQREKVDAEIELHAAASEVGHPNVAGFEANFENGRIICLVLELCEKKSLAQYLRRKEFLREAEVSDIIWQILSGLSHIHGSGLLHRDLKLGNILLSEDMTVKIGDFGLATRAAWGKRRTICGTPNFIAPEVLQRQGHAPESDIWAVGCILYTLLVGKPPFETTSLKDTYKCILKNSYRIPSTISQEAADLVRWMLRSKPHARPSLQEVTKHVFFVKNQTHLRFPSIEEMAKQYPSKEVSVEKILPLRRKSVLPRLQVQDESRSWMSEMYSSSTRHNSCPTNPCSMYSSQRVRAVPTTTSGPKISLANHMKQATIVRESASSSHLHIEEENVQAEQQQQRTPVEQLRVDAVDCAFTKEENNNTKAGNNNTDVEEKAVVVDETTTQIVESENQKNNTKSLLSKNKKTPRVKQASSIIKSKTSSPVKLLASKLQKFKIPSPKNCLRAAGGTKKSRGNTSDSTISSTNDKTPIREFAQATWITKWVDYSNKYGFGYQLADGTICVLFNDGSHIALLPDLQTVEYTEPEWESSCSSHVFPLSSPPNALTRVVKILQHFRTYMDRNLTQTRDASSNCSKDSQRLSVRMLTWSRTADHVSMYLSNGTLQINYADHTKVNVTNIHRKSSMAVSYVNEKKQTATYAGNELSAIKDPEVQDIMEKVHKEFHLLLGSDDCISHPFCGSLKAPNITAPQALESLPVMA